MNYIGNKLLKQLKDYIHPLIKRLQIVIWTEDDRLYMWVVDYESYNKILNWSGQWQTLVPLFLKTPIGGMANAKIKSEHPASPTLQLASQQSHLTHIHMVKEKKEKEIGEVENGWAAIILKGKKHLVLIYS